MVQPELKQFDRVDDGVPIRGGIEARHLSYSHPGQWAKRAGGRELHARAWPEAGHRRQNGQRQEHAGAFAHQAARSAGGPAFHRWARYPHRAPPPRCAGPLAMCRRTVFLFNTTIEGQHRLFHRRFARSSEAAAAQAGLSTDLSAMPHGLQTICGEHGNHLSGGHGSACRWRERLCATPPSCSWTTRSPP